MADLFDYLYWRDDLTLGQIPFNAVDAVILSRLSYLPFEFLGTQILLAPISIHDAALTLLNHSIIQQSVLMQEDLRLLSFLSHSERFGKMNLFAYENKRDATTETQFSAMTVELEENRHFVIYRGTDSTLVGWKENFNMAFICPVPAQTIALQYLEKISAETTGELMVGGHSKGGNLAVYASAYSAPEVQQRITQIYNFDGPGFNDTVLATPGYQNICHRISTYVPQASVVGMLLGREEEYTIIHSSQSSGLQQHNVYSWDVTRSGFQYVDTVTSGSKFIDATVKSWLAAVECDEREKFIDTVYEIISSTDAETLGDLRKNWFDHAVTVTKAFRELDDNTRKVVDKTIRALLHSTKEELEQLVRAPQPAPLLSKNIKPQ